LLSLILFLFATRLALSTAMRLNLFARRVLIIGAPDDAARTVRAIEALRPGCFLVAGLAAPDDATPLDAATLRQRRVWGVVVTTEARGAVAQDALMRAKYADIRIFGDVEFREQQLRRI